MKKQIQGYINEIAEVLHLARISLSDKITFGNNPNQEYHAFRHIDKLGLDRTIVQKGILEHFSTMASEIEIGQTTYQIVEIEGHTLQYSAHMLADGTN